MDASQAACSLTEGLGLGAACYLAIMVDCGRVGLSTIAMSSSWGTCLLSCINCILPHPQERLLVFLLWGEKKNFSVERIAFQFSRVEWVASGSTSHAPAKALMSVGHICRWLRILSPPCFLPCSSLHHTTTAEPKLPVLSSGSRERSLHPGHIPPSLKAFPVYT